jgi:hypothetical protein
MKNSKRNKANAEAKAKKEHTSKYALKGKAYEYEFKQYGASRFRRDYQ